ncbi:hypothetical protein SAY86_013685 [Trapa natans]|uniref:BZIP domain-containing protein n=1 Tax=Trapa natans TaxID=22666 RepID=A0AAN7KXS2_TRANT|nr:hypothetical protein SAY86_013685 [Trapa natans]
MGTREGTTSSKSSKPASSSQELPTIPAYPDWSSPMQAYYGTGITPPFFTSTVASPTPHPYLWGNQHPMIPPYGTPVPYTAIYPHGGVYAHPNMAMTPVSAPTTNTVAEGKGAEGKDGTSSKRHKGTAGYGGKKAGQGVKATSGSGNDGDPQSGDSGSEGSSDANEDNNPQEFGTSTSQDNAAGANVHPSLTGKPVSSAPATNLNIGMDVWNSSSAHGAAKIRPTVSPALVPSAMMPDQWIQDEREIKRQRRKQSNRESARRSRLRKQAECEELQAKVESLTTENSTLKGELQRLTQECETLASENNSIKEELARVHLPEPVPDLEKENSGTGQAPENEK